eukprot:TRINITY_DN27373_c0_g1_i2.p1 TRINITY_DN27373_c0_g1~~TRINITY_DN27373_c0_g1_i2.p1  ORF type:complete len:847 (+),score=92.87 TRINITY_DN27373_c0_g1_i2:36-2543(+)
MKCDKVMMASDSRLRCSGPWLLLFTIILVHNVYPIRLADETCSKNDGPPNLGVGALVRGIGRWATPRAPKNNFPVNLRAPPNSSGINEGASEPFQSSLRKTSSYPCDLDKLRAYLHTDAESSLDGVAAFDKEWAYMMKVALPYLTEVRSIESPLADKHLHDKKGAEFVREPTKLLEIDNVKKRLNSWTVLSSLQTELLQQLIWESTSPEHFQERGFQRGWIWKETKTDMLKSITAAALASVSIGSELGAFSGLYANVGIEHGLAFNVANKVSSEATLQITEWGSKLAATEMFQSSAITSEGLVGTLQWLEEHPTPKIDPEIVNSFHATYSNFDMVVADTIGTSQNVSASVEYSKMLQASARACSALSLVALQIKLKTDGVHAPLETFPDIQQGHLYSVYAKIRDLLGALMIASNTNPIVRHDAAVNEKVEDNRVVRIFKESADDFQDPSDRLPRGTLLMGTGRHVPTENHRTLVRWRVDNANGTAGFREGWIPSIHANRAPAYFVVNRSLSIYSLVGGKCTPTSGEIQVNEDFYVRSRSSLKCPGCSDSGCYCMELASTGEWVCPRSGTHGLSIRKVAKSNEDDGSVPYKLEEDDAGDAIGKAQHFNKEDKSLFVARVGVFALGLTAAIGGLLCPAGAATLGVMGMVSGGVAATDSIFSGVLNAKAQKNVDVRLEAFLFALAKWEYFLVKSPSDCDITDVSEAKEGPCDIPDVTDSTKVKKRPRWVCLRDFVFFNTDGSKASQGWCVPALQPLQATGMPCTLSKECSSGYCHYGAGEGDLDSTAKEKYEQVMNTYNVKEEDLKAVVRSTGTCRNACKVEDDGCKPLSDEFNFGIK